MKNKISTVAIIALALVWLALTAGAWFGEAEAYSIAERRKLDQAPKLSWETIFAEDVIVDGEIKEEKNYMTLFKSYSLDQFPLRDQMRQLKSVFTYYVMGQIDNNGIYISDGYVAQMEYPLDTTKLEYNLSVIKKGVFNKLQLGNPKKGNIYIAVIPDKNYYLAEERGALKLDYDALYREVQETFPDSMSNLTHIDLRDVLSKECYYRTDTHWRQEMLIPVANRIAEAMGVTVQQAEDYTVQPVETPFYGVHYGHAALPMNPETINLMQSQLLSECEVFIFNTEDNKWEAAEFYNMEKETGYDLYEIFLSGVKPLVQINNPNATTDKELIVFRDSFGSSIAPLLVKDYAKVTLVDLRMINVDLLPQHLTMHGQDVLFLYNTLMLNSNRIDRVA